MNETFKGMPSDFLHPARHHLIKIPQPLLQTPPTIKDLVIKYMSLWWMFFIYNTTVHY